MDDKIDLLAAVEDPASHLIAKLQDVLAALTTMKARIDIIEDHLVFLLSQNSKYLDMLQKKSATEANDNGNQDKPIL